MKPTGTVTGGGGWPLASDAASARASSQYDRAADAAVPVNQYSVMLSTMRSRVRLPVGLPVDEGAGDLVVAVRVVVEQPGGQGDR